jgi:hypothetical protein
MNSETNVYINGDLDKLYYIILNINLLLDYWWWTYTEIPQLGKTKSASGIFNNWVFSIKLSIEICLIGSNFLGSLIVEKFEIAEWNGCQIVTFNVLNDLNKVVNEFPSISTVHL